MSFLKLRDRHSVILLLFLKVAVIHVVGSFGEWLWAEALEHLSHLTLMFNTQLLLFCLGPVAGSGPDLRNLTLGVCCEADVLGHFLQGSTYVKLAISLEKFASKVCCETFGQISGPVLTHSRGKREEEVLFNLCILRW